MTPDEAIERLDKFYGNAKVDFPKLPITEALGDAIEALKEKKEREKLTPCDVCQFNPPSSGDGKPCCMCPAC